MDVQVEETGPVERKLRVEIPTADVDAAFDSVYRSLRKAAKIPGFRQGKVPRTVMTRYFGERARSDVLEHLVQDTLGKAVEEADLAAIGEPRFHTEEAPQEGEPFVYEATFDIRPVIELKLIRGLEITQPELPEPEQDPIERHLEELQQEHAQVAEEEAGTACARGHQAVIDYEASVDGEPFDGGAGSETVVEVGDGRAIPGLEDELIGLTVGDEREFDLTLPDTYPAEPVAGKEAHFKVRLVGLKRRDLPSLDDEFAKDVSEFDSLDALRADLQEKVDASRDKERKRLAREATVDALVEANPFPVPESLIERQLNQRLMRAANQLRQLPQEQLAELVEGWREEWRSHAERDVRLALLVPEISDACEIELSEADIDERLQTMAEESGQPLAQLKRTYKEQGLIEALRSGLLEERVVDFLVSEATVSGA